jgi:3',5'-cyclic AMP phosphodiesterase CpdA
MTLLAHISDLHLNGAQDRRQKLATALDKAFSMRPDHLVITGDVTASGKRWQLDELAGMLGGWPTGVTTVLGNHDGSLVAPPASCLDFGDVALIPVDTRVPRRAFVFTAAGRIGKAQFARIEQMTRDSRKPIVLAMHHGPQAHPLHVFDGLIDRAAVRSLIRARPWVSILCGHDHRVLDFGRVHVASSVAHHEDPLRTYEVRGGALIPAYRSYVEGRYFS